jgi:RimJ/RimL family protein N-acetyltransferase
MALATHYRTARLALRPVVASDEAAVVAAIDDIAVSGWLIPVPHPYSVADFHVFLKEVAAPGEEFVIEDAEGFVGLVGLSDDLLGYWLDPRAHGRGYATEAARCLVTAHFAGGGGRLASGYFEGNLRSANVLRKLGFVETDRDRRFCKALGVERPHVNTHLTREAFV